jgi:hypothetical protein
MKLKKSKSKTKPKPKKVSFGVGGAKANTEIPKANMGSMYKEKKP